ncbi:MAG: ATP synthase subunit I [Gammaproteobacteria bacterium]|nr:ATP synthase subunit I [Gammaproteobacteria bacterium]
MKFAGLVLKKTVKKLLIKQLIFSLIVAIIGFFIGGLTALLAALYGGLITIVGTILMSNHVYRAAKVSSASSRKQQGYIEIYLGVIKKFVATLMLFALGIAILGLSPGMMVISFIVTQFSYLFNQVDTSYSKVNAR